MNNVAPIYPAFIRDEQGNIMTDENGQIYDYGNGAVYWTKTSYLT